MTTESSLVPGELMLRAPMLSKPRKRIATTPEKEKRISITVYCYNKMFFVTTWYIIIYNRSTTCGERIHWGIKLTIWSSPTSCVGWDMVRPVHYRRPSASPQPELCNVLRYVCVVDDLSGRPTCRRIRDFSVDVSRASFLVRMPAVNLPDTVVITVITPKAHF